MEVALSVLSIDIAGSHKKMMGQSAAKIDREFQSLKKSIGKIFDKYKNNSQHGKWSGDGKIVIFKDPSQAVDSAKTIIRNCLWGNINFDIRIAIHYGKMIFRRSVGDIHSPTINIAERLQKSLRNKNALIITEDFYTELKAGDRIGFKRVRKKNITKPKMEIRTRTYTFLKSRKKS